MGDTASGQTDEGDVETAPQRDSDTDAAPIPFAVSLLDPVPPQPTESAAGVAVSAAAVPHANTEQPARPFRPAAAPAASAHVVEPTRDVFLVAAAVDVVSARAGTATLASSPPRWLCANGGGLTAGALAVLAEIALTTAASTTAGDREEVVAASLHLEVEGYPLEDGRVRPSRLGGPFAMRAPTKTAPVVPQAGRVSMTATVKASADAPLRHVTGTVTDASGVVVAIASALCALVPAPTLPAVTRPSEGDGTTRPTVEARPLDPVAVVTVPADPTLTAPAVSSAATAATTTIVGDAANQLAQVSEPDFAPLATNGGGDEASPDLPPLTAPLRPLLGSLGATMKTDGDRTWIRFAPAGWQTNRAGGLHGAAACAVADAAVDAALGKVLPPGSAVQLRSLEMTFLRSIPSDAEVEAVVTVVHVGRRLAVIDCEIGPAGARPSALARVIAARTTHR